MALVAGVLAAQPRQVLRSLYPPTEGRSCRLALGSSEVPPTLGRLTHVRSKHLVLSQLRVVHKADRPPPVAHPCPFCLADSHPATPSPRCPRAPVAHRSACWQALLLSDSRCAKATSISDHVSARAASACADVYIPGPIGGARRATAVGGSLRWSACPAVWPPCKCAPGAARPREYPPP